MNNNIINNAIQECLTIGPVENWNYSDKICKKYGKKIWNQISEILVFIDTIQPNWSEESFEEFLIRVFNETHNKYPLLHENSIQVLKNRVAYRWK